MMDPLTQFVAVVTRELVRARKEAGFTQEEVARAMGTKQAQVSRIENSKRGAFGLHTITDYALAIGYAPCSFEMAGPFEFHLIPLAEARECILDDPTAPLNWRHYLRWKAKRLKEMDPPRQTSAFMGLTTNAGLIRLAS